MNHEPFIFAVDGGATETRGALYTQEGHLLAESVAGPGNPVEYGISVVGETLRTLGQRLGIRSCPFFAGGLAGAGSLSLQRALAEQVASFFDIERLLVLDDLSPLLLANMGTGGGVLTLAGPGSCVLALNSRQEMVRIGGRGRIMGDQGSAYRIAEEALRAAALAMDGIGPETCLATCLMAAVGVNTFSELVRWLAEADKRAIARLSHEVNQAAEAGDCVAMSILRQQADGLARQTHAAMMKAQCGHSGNLLYAGGLLENAACYRTCFQEALAALQVAEPVSLAPLRSHRAVFDVAHRVATGTLAMPIVSDSLFFREDLVFPSHVDLLPQTEQALPDSPALDTLSALEIVDAMNRQDDLLASVVQACRIPIAEVMEQATRSLHGKGRLIYLGAGTSGRLGVLDASECPPTFGVDPGRVVGLIAGGDRALRSSIEGAEDDDAAAEKDLNALSPPLSATDLVVGIAASGRTPYVLAGLRHARRQGASTALMACNRIQGAPADYVIALNTGPEVLPGSTRLKAGTATKMVLNMISTGALTRAGFVHEGRMVAMRPVNQKLRERAIRIVQELVRCSCEDAERWLDEAHGEIRVAVLMAKESLSREAAVCRLDHAGGRLRDAFSGE